jgi:hypothetical protein
MAPEPPPTETPQKPLRLERRGEAPASRRHFLRRQAAYTALALIILTGALGIGMAGYRLTGVSDSWLDAFLNASMILGGMGPLDRPETRGGKLFAGFYALFAGVVFLLAAGAVVTPIFHRILHHFHLDPDSDST